MKNWLYAIVTLATVGLVLAASAGAAGLSTVRLRDRCDSSPEGGWGALCSPAYTGGNTTRQEFNDEFAADGIVGAWKYGGSDRDKIRLGDVVNAHNEGGETHTFTPVSEYGGGIIVGLNGGQPIADGCANRDLRVATTVPSGGTSAPVVLDRGSHKFQCCLHPWMRKEFVVR